MENPVYALGHSDRELKRLSVQERLIGPATRQFFREAGIGCGMRVLDFGSGAGDCAFLVADLVGEAGSVIGTDKAAIAVRTATQRVEAGECSPAQKTREKLAPRRILTVWRTSLRAP